MRNQVVREMLARDRLIARAVEWLSRSWPESGHVRLNEARQLITDLLVRLQLEDQKGAPSADVQQ